MLTNIPLYVVYLSLFSATAAFLNFVFGLEYRLNKSDLSTEHAPAGEEIVDKSIADHWLGCVVPKRHARRAVTRSLLKRQIRAALGRHVGGLQPGLWLVRLRAPFVKSDFPSAASIALQRGASEELDRLFARAAV